MITETALRNLEHLADPKIDGYSILDEETAKHVRELIAHYRKTQGPLPVVGLTQHRDTITCCVMLALQDGRLMVDTCMSEHVHKLLQDLAAALVAVKGMTQ